MKKFKADNMPQEQMILNIGDMVETSNSQKGRIEKIRIISSGKLVDRYAYNGEGADVVLTIKDEIGVINLWLKGISVHEMTERQKKGASHG